MKKGRVKAERIYFELLNACNFGCDFCPIHETKRKRQPMDFDLFRQGIDSIVENDLTKNVSLFLLGEPLMYPRIIEAIKYAKGHGLNVYINTNGSLLDRENTLKLLAAGVHELSISLETLDEHGHEARHSSIEFGEYYGRILDAIKLIGSSDSTMKLEISLMNTNSAKYFDISKVLGINQEGTKFLDQLTVLIGDIYRLENRDYSPDTIEQSLRKLKLNEPQRIILNERTHVYVQMLCDWGNSFTKGQIHPCKIGFCGYALDNAAVLSDGTVTICCADYDGSTSLGNLKEDNLYALLSSQKMGKIKDAFARFEIIHPYCQRCFGSTSRIKSVVKGLASIVLFKGKSHPAHPREVRLGLN